MRNLTTLLISVTTTAVLALPGTANSQGTTVKAAFKKPPTRRESSQSHPDLCKEAPSLPGCFPSHCEVQAMLRFESSYTQEAQAPECPKGTEKANDSDRECQLPTQRLAEMTPIRVGDFILNGFVEANSLQPYFEAFKSNTPRANWLPGVEDLKSLENGIVIRAPLINGREGVYFLTPAIPIDETWRQQYHIDIQCH